MTSADLSIITLVMNASVVVKCVMGILLIASLSSWATIFSKMLVLSRSRRQTDDFEKRFWSGLDLAKLYETANTRPERTGAQERMFVAGMNEFLKMPDRPADDVLSGVRRSMNATFGSVSPYIGLFGTVWGIMDAFTGLSSLENVSLAVVAPGIAEALVATAVGLFAAIPATAAYNLFANRIERLSNRFDSFSEEFLNILAHQR